MAGENAGWSGIPKRSMDRASHHVVPDNDSPANDRPTIPSEVNEEERDRILEHINSDAARRSRRRRRHMDVRIQKAYFANEKRIAFLERTIEELSSELQAVPAASATLQPSSKVDSGESRRNTLHHSSGVNPEWCEAPL